MKIKRKRKENHNLILIVVLLIFVSGISIVYASFTDNLKIIGTANANGRFDVEFISGKIIDAKGINVLASRADISEDKDTLTIDIRDMQYPGAGATVSCVVKNTGTVPAKLKNINITGNDDEDISVIFEDTNKLGQTLQVNDMWTLKFVVKWNIDSTAQNNKAINFNISLDYEQDVQEYSSGI